MIAPSHPRFRWLEHGDGQPVLLRHGLMGEMDHWGSTLDALGPYRRPIALELPIFDPDLIEVSVPALADDVRRFMEALELPPAVVGGNSLGGHVALELALTHPGWVEGLILTGSSGLFERSFSPHHVPHAPTRAYVRERMEEIFYDPALVTPEWVEAIRRVVTTRRTALRVLQVARAAKRHNLEDRLSQITCPPCSCGARTTASRRPTSPSDSTRASAARSSCICRTAGTRRCSSAPRRSTPPSPNGSSTYVPGAPRGAAHDRARRRRGAPRLRGAPAADPGGRRARRRARSRGRADRPRERGALHRVRTLASVRADPDHRRLSGAHAARRLSEIPADLEPRDQRRARSHVAGASTVLGDDVGNHGRRQDDPGDARGIPRASQGWLGRAVDGRRALGLREHCRRSAAVPRRLHQSEAHRARLLGGRPVGPHGPGSAARLSLALFAGPRDRFDPRTGTSGSTRSPS